MSTDERIASKLVKTLENGKLGYEKAAEKVQDAGRADLAERFRGFAQERAAMAQELDAIAAAYGDDIDERSTVPGALHRGWMALKDAFTGDDVDAVVRTVEQGEDHAVSEYRDALEADVSPEFRSVLARQMSTVRSAHDYVRSQVPA
jgi:uncharacterized protein (TIGR02284 family)